MFKSQSDYFQLNKQHTAHGMTTRLVHCANEPGQEFGGVSATLDFSTTFAQPAPGQPVVFDYSRCGNPTRLALER
jgi:cystathionine gamma-lyase